MRLTAAAAALLVLACTGCTAKPSAAPAAGSSAPPSPSGATAGSAATPGTPSPPSRPRAVRTGLRSWHTPEPVSRPVVLPAGGGSLLLAGGLVAGSSTSRVYRLDPRTGRARPAGGLATPTHDAAGVAVHGRAFVLGGGVSSSTDLVQETGAAPGRSGRVVGHLPHPRSDAAGARIGGTGYVVGGYDGRAADAGVLATRDGRTFRTVARLRVPVRYAAVAAAGGVLWVLGGEAVSGPHAGAPVDTVQRVDPRHHRARVVGHLPAPLQGAVAFTLGSSVYLAGGTSASGSASRASRTVFSFDPHRDAVRRVGRLRVAAAYAGVAVLGDTAWILGGESAGRTLSSVQTVVQRVASSS